MTKDLKKSVKKEDQMSTSSKKVPEKEAMKTKDLGAKEFTSATEKVAKKLAYAAAYAKIENTAFGNEDSADDLVTRREDGELVKVLRDSPPVQEAVKLQSKKGGRTHTDPDILEIGEFEAGTRVPEAYDNNSPVEVFHFIGRCAPDGELYEWLLRKAATAYIHGRRLFLHVKADSETGQPLAAYDVIEDIKTTAVAMKATGKQLEYLKILGYNGPTNITKHEASELIDKLRGYVKKTEVLPSGKVITKINPQYTPKKDPPPEEEKTELVLPDAAGGEDA